MASHSSVTELRKMSIEDLKREINEISVSVAKMRLGIEMKKEKNSSKYKAAKKYLARLKTILSEKMIEESLKSEPSTSTVSPTSAS